MTGKELKEATAKYVLIKSKKRAIFFTKQAIHIINFEIEQAKDKPHFRLHLKYLNQAKQNLQLTLSFL